MERQRTCAAELVAAQRMEDLPQERTHEIRLSGPSSPLEMKVYGKVNALRGRSVTVNIDSVNSVMLDDLPGDRHERLLVAAQVQTSIS